MTVDTITSSGRHLNSSPIDRDGNPWLPVLLWALAIPSIHILLSIAGPKALFLFYASSFFTVPLMVYGLILMRFLQALNVATLYEDRKRYLKKSGLNPDVVLHGKTGNLIAFETAKKRLFVDREVYDFQDVSEVSTEKLKNLHAVSIDFSGGKHAMARLIVRSEFEAAEYARRILGLIHS